MVSAPAASSPPGCRGEGMQAPRLQSAAGYQVQCPMGMREWGISPKPLQDGGGRGGDTSYELPLQDTCPEQDPTVPDLNRYLESKKPPQNTSFCPTPPPPCTWGYSLPPMFSVFFQLSMPLRALHS